MANTSTKVVAILAIVLVFLEVSACAAGRHFRGTPAVMSLSGFEKGQRAGGWPASCDGKYYNDGLFLASVTSRWYAGRCGKVIRVRSSAGLVVEAMVVDECGIEKACSDSEISTSAAVWKALGVDAGVRQVSIAWSDLN